MMIGTGFGIIDRDIELGKEYKIGTFTLNGVTHNRYFKIIDFGALPDTATKYVSSGIDSQISILSMGGVAWSSSYYVTIPYIATNQARLVYAVQTNEVGIATTADYSGYSDCYVTLEYYK